MGLRGRIRRLGKEYQEQRAEERAKRVSGIHVDPSVTAGLTWTASYTVKFLTDTVGPVNAAKVMGRLHARIKDKQKENPHYFLTENEFATWVQEESLAVVKGQ